jgi:hypothetical protein
MDQEGIDLDRDHAVGALQQRLGQRAFSGSDFDHDRRTLAAGGNRNAVQNRFTCEKMLPEASAQI